jgi:hypothetical protein
MMTMEDLVLQLLKGTGTNQGIIYHLDVFTIRVPKKNDLFLKDCKEQLWIFVYFTLL